MLPRGMARTISIIGAGRVGATLGKRLRQLGWRVRAVVTRSEWTSRAAVRAIGGGTARSLLSADVLDADVILLTTPDNALAEVARLLAKIGGRACRGKVILHTSGALDRGMLDPLARLGASTGSLHPMQTFSGRNMPRLEGVTFAVEGEAKALRAAKRIARSLGGAPVAIASADKPVYHATAVLAAGSGFALIEAAVQMLVKIGFTRRRAFETLLPLTRQMLDNVERLGPRAAWTGPLSRGDFAVIAKHVRALRRYSREFQESYAALALLAGRVLAKNPDATLRNLRRVLKKSKGDNR
ncbi:MAG TPA: Rossmann-like and DUF2520 domain-containing protein [Candidatus Dormibacteraeota bacterium]|nr:Rossmann-like and DUF2520 domain-containing protein [Candidatus Dormibacteraeota bacterium]